MADMLRFIRNGVLSAGALIAIVAALAPATIATGPDGALWLEAAVALADDDDDDDDDDDRDDDDDDDWDDDDDDDDG